MYVCMCVRVLHLYLNYTICLRSSVNDNTCLLGDAILRIPRVSPTLIGHAGYARVRAYRTRDTYDGVLSATSKRQPSFHSSIFSSVVPPAIVSRLRKPHIIAQQQRARTRRTRGASDCAMRPTAPCSTPARETSS